MVSSLYSGASSPGLSPGRGHRVVFLGKTLHSHGARLRPGVQKPVAKTSEVFCFRQLFCVTCVPSQFGTRGWTKEFRLCRRIILQNVQMCRRPYQNLLWRRRYI